MIYIAKPFLGEEEAKAAHDAVLSGWVTQGPRVQEFEENFARYVGSRYAVAVSNCTTALHLSLVVAGIKTGDEVICPSMSYIATANCIVHANATPVFAEVNPVTFNLDIEDVKKRITNKTKAIILVHQIGIPADIEEYQDLCKEHNLILVEDAACAAGSSYKGKKIGSHSDYVCFSFHPRKVITTGDGGMITTSSEEIYNRLKLLRQHGMSINDRQRHASKVAIIEDHLEIGYNYRMTDIQAAIGIHQLNRLDWLIAERKKVARKYYEAFRDLKTIEVFEEPSEIEWNYQSYPLYVHKDSKISRNELMQLLLDKGVASRRGIMTSHRETAYAHLRHLYQLPVSEQASDSTIMIPIYTLMSDEDVATVIQAVKDIMH